MSTIEQKLAQLLGQTQFQLVSNLQTIEEQAALITKLENELEELKDNRRTPERNQVSKSQAVT